MYSVRWLTHTTSLVQFCMFSVRGRFRGRITGGHSYVFLQICQLVKYVWFFTKCMNLCEQGCTNKPPHKICTNWREIRLKTPDCVDSCLNGGILPTQFCRATVNATAPLYRIFTRCDTMPQSAIKVSSIRVFVLTSHNNGMSDRFVNFKYNFALL